MFPTQFPTGHSEYMAPRHRQITLGQFLKYLILYETGRLAQRYFALNTTLRWQALENDQVRQAKNWRQSNQF